MRSLLVALVVGGGVIASVSAHAQAVTAPSPSGTANVVPKFTGATSIGNSAITDSGGTVGITGNVGINTGAPLAPLHVVGSGVLVSGPTAHQIQLSGATVGRFGQDGAGLFLSSDTTGFPLRFYTSGATGLTEHARLKSTGIFSVTPNAAIFGEIAFGRSDLDGAYQTTQAGQQVHFRLSRPCPDPNPLFTSGACTEPGVSVSRDFIIAPYRYGMGVFYPGTLEFWNNDFSVHHADKNRGCDGDWADPDTESDTNPSLETDVSWRNPKNCFAGGSFVVGDTLDAGGLHINARGIANPGCTPPCNPLNHQRSHVVIASETFGLGWSHGSMRFEVKENGDEFSFWYGGAPVPGDEGIRTRKIRFDWSGKGFFNGGTQVGGADFAESVDVTEASESFEPGDVMAIDPNATRRFTRSDEAYSTRVAGVYSTRPGVLATTHLMDAEELKSQVPLAVIGIVPTKVTTENGPIRPGDLLVSSSRPGYAMRAGKRRDTAGMLIGKALGSLDKGEGKVEVLLTLR